jgi:hypothetical protein
MFVIVVGEKLKQRKQIIIVIIEHWAGVANILERCVMRHMGVSGIARLITVCSAMRACVKRF